MHEGIRAGRAPGGVPAGEPITSASGPRGRKKGSGRAGGGKPLRPRDFVEDRRGWLYSVAAYDNADRVGCVLRYVPDSSGDRVNPEGTRCRKIDFEESFRLVGDEEPSYLEDVLRIPRGAITRVYKPEERLAFCAARDPRVAELVDIFSLPAGSLGCTGSRLLGLECPSSDIDLVVYGRAFFRAREILREAVGCGRVDGLSPEMWRTIYAKREPEIPFPAFLLHEQRKWNRGEIGGTYFDLLYTRSYDDLDGAATLRGKRIGKRTLEARVTDATHSYDTPASYLVDHGEVSRILSFTHTYSGQALGGETVEACGVLEEHGDELWLVVGTTRTARGEYIVSRTLLEEQG
ncbi:MAG TPA: DNA polymerase subunit beta [Methanomicrobiales archaeon]|nr:DNA polymerase subunit beta [Methanomicrobiales archaeon]